LLAGKGSAATLAALKAAPAGSKSLQYLGRSGVTQLESLNVAFLDGTFHSKAFFAKPRAHKTPPPGEAAAAADATTADEAAAAAAAAAAGDDDNEALTAAAAADDDAGAGDGEAAAAAAGTAAEPSPKAPAFHSCKHYNQSDVAKLRHQLMVLPGEVDILLTCEWPAGALQQLPPGTATPEGEMIVFRVVVGCVVDGFCCSTSVLG
jgi:hypothetical protein